MTGAPHTIFFALRPLLYTAPEASEASEASGGNLFHLLLLLIPTLLQTRYTTHLAPEGSEASGGNLFHLPFPASAGISIYPLPSFIAIIAARQYTHSEYCQNCVRLYSLEGIVRA